MELTAAEMLTYATLPLIVEDMPFGRSFSFNCGLGSHQEQPHYVLFSSH
jgi:hypothetical protein